MSAKIIRDSLYNYISIDQKRDRWLVELLGRMDMHRNASRLPVCVSGTGP
jgi:hypothetical protein